MADLHIPAPGIDPAEHIAELAGEAARHLMLAAEDIGAHHVAAPNPILRLEELRIGASLPCVVVADDPWPESARALVAWAVLRAYTHRQAARAALLDALHLADAVGCETAGILARGMEVADA